MKAARLYFKDAGVGISLIFLLAISPMVLYSAAGSVGANTCTNDVLQYKMATATLPMSQQTAIGVAESSSQYKGYTTNAAVVNDSRAAEEWTFNRTACTVALNGLSVNFDIAFSNGTRQIVVVDVNPTTSTINKAAVFPWSSASPLSVGNGTAYSGYGVCSDSACDDENLTGIVSYYTAPAIAAPSGTYDGQTEPNCHYSSGICEIAVWAGLATCDYTGQPTSCPSSSSVVQAGLLGEVKHIASNSTTIEEEFGFYEYYGQSVPLTRCLSDVATSGDSMESEIENQYLVTSIAGDHYYAYSMDQTQSWDCNDNVGTTSYQPYYGDYIVERTQNYTACGSSCQADDQWTLPYFSTINLQSDQVFHTSWVGAYDDYNPGYGFGVQMVNSKGGTDYQNTATSTMSAQTTGGKDYGSFDVTYDDSIGT
jgi:hypothetical protein